jgi:hypothetical protein
MLGISVKDLGRQIQPNTNLKPAVNFFADGVYLLFDTGHSIFHEIGVFLEVNGLSAQAPQNGRLTSSEYSISRRDSTCSKCSTR